MNSLLSTTAFGCAIILLWSACSAQPQRLETSDAEASVRELWESIRPQVDPNAPKGQRRDWQLQYTTWLPNEWPPTPKTLWIRYAYGLDVTLDGVAGVSAPFARIERERRGESHADCIVPMARSISSVATHPVRPTNGWHYTVEDEKHMLDLALGLTSAPPADARGAIGLASYFKSWRLGHAEIADIVKPSHRAFFAWLDQS